MAFRGVIGGGRPAIFLSRRAISVECVAGRIAADRTNGRFQSTSQMHYFKLAFNV